MSKRQDVTERLEDRREDVKAAAQHRADARAEAIAAAKARAEALVAQKRAAREVAAEEARVRAEERAAAAAQARALAAEEARSKAQARETAQAEARARGASAATPAADITGKQRLIDAAMRLHREKRSFASLGIREIAREAHLNPNTFYRHFESIDDLAVAAVMQCGDRLRPMLHQIRTLASRVDPVSVAALEVSAFYAFALGNMDAFVVGVTEYHGGSERVREAIAALLHDVASEMRDDIAELALFPSISREHLEIACTQIVVHLFHLSQEYIEKPDRRAAIIEASECMIVWMIAGAALGTPAKITTMLAPIVGR
jgi:AcrR family transcriptional regulator